MVKVKNSKSKKGASSMNNNRNVNKAKKMNPFEVHVNRQKYDIIGRKLKHDKGLPGVARTKAIKKRKATLLQEYKIKNKNNEFVDRRIGERNREMTAEDRIIARFTAERVRSKKKSIFNLADDEILTHKGQTLNEIEKFDDPRSDEEDEDNGRLEADFVGDVHFGGGFLRKKEDTGNSAQGRQNLIQQLISESKKRKAEKQRENEKTAELTDKLDAAWKDLQPIILKSKKKNSKDVEKEDDQEIKPRMDSYDRAVRELKFEARGKPSDRLKSEEEIALEEKEKLEQLEADRIQRMHGVTEGNKSASKHRSADDLDDGFEIEEAEETLSYNEQGQLMQTGTSLDVDSEFGAQEVDVSNIEADTREDENMQSCSEEESADEESDDDFNDLKLSSSEEDEEESIESPAKNGLWSPDTKEKKKNIEPRDVNKIKADLLAWKITMEKARQELPYVFQVPETYEELQQILENKPICQQSVVLERMTKCTHPSLGAGNRERLNTLFAFILQWLHDNAVEKKEKGFEINPNRELMHAVLPHLYDLAQLGGPGNARRCMAAILTEKYTEWIESCTSQFPGFDTLMFFQLVPHLFPASDFRHPVSSPAVVMMANMLTSSKIASLEDICHGLHICQTLLQYTALSKRFLPESFRFLTGVLMLTLSGKSREKYLEEFDLAHTNGPWNYQGLGSSFLKENTKTLYFHHILQATLSLILEMAAQIKDTVPSWSNLLAPAVEILHHISAPSLKKYPKAVIEKIELLKNEIKDNGGLLNKIVAEKKRPKPLKMFEPAIERVFEGKRQGPMSEKKLERIKLRHKYKREMKGAIREIRRDRSFLAKLKMKETLRSDAERKEKVKQIMGSLATQAGEINKLDRKKKWK